MKTNDHTASCGLRGHRVILCPLLREFASDEYLAWLNDPDVLRYRAPKSRTMSWEDMVAWLDEVPDDSRRFAITVDGRHIGNISLDGIQQHHATADLGIMLGAKDVWGKGYGKEAIEVLTQFGFGQLGLHRISASSPNPAFNAIMRSLGWEHEGTAREAFLCEGQHIDIERWAILASKQTPA